ARHTPDPNRPLDVLAAVGGLEIAAIAGACLGAAAARCLVVVDGFIASAGTLVALRLAPAARPYCVFAHRSPEPGHAAILAALDASPLLDLEMRLGEGTGACLGLAPAVRFLTVVPVPGSTVEVGTSALFFPLVGFALGGVLVALDRVTAPVVPLAIRDVLLVGVLVVITGGLHLDGLADAADGLFT